MKINEAFSKPSSSVSYATKSKPIERRVADFDPLSLAKPVSPAIYHDIDEMRDTIKADLATVKKKKADLQDELVLTK